MMQRMSSEDNIPVPNQILEVRPKFDYACNEPIFKTFALNKFIILFFVVKIAQLVMIMYYVYSTELLPRVNSTQSQ